MAKTRTYGTLSPEDIDYFAARARGFRGQLPDNTPVEEQPEQRGALRALGDWGTSLVQGAVDVNKALSNVGGAENAVSSGLGGVSDYVGSLRSREAAARREEHARLMKEAEQNGGWAEAGQAVSNFFDAPVDYSMQGAGSVLGLFPWMRGASLAAGGLGAGATAARMIGGASVGAPVGVGAVKGSQYQEVYDYIKSRGGSDEEAATAATQAQAYGADNLVQHGLGAGLGVVDLLTGGEAALMGGKLVGANIGKRALRRGLEEGGTEFPQAFQEKYAGNVAAIDAGDVTRTPTQGAWGAGTQEMLMGTGPGAAFGAMEKYQPTQAEIDASVEQSRLEQQAKAQEETNKYLQGLREEEEAAEAQRVYDLRVEAMAELPRTEFDKTFKEREKAHKEQVKAATADATNLYQKELLKPGGPSVDSKTFLAQHLGRLGLGEELNADAEYAAALDEIIARRNEVAEGTWEPDAPRGLLRGPEQRVDPRDPSTPLLGFNANPYSNDPVFVDQQGTASLSLPDRQEPLLATSQGRVGTPEQMEIFQKGNQDLTDAGIAQQRDLFTGALGPARKYAPGEVDNRGVRQEPQVEPTQADTSRNYDLFERVDTVPPKSTANGGVAPESDPALMQFAQEQKVLGQYPRMLQRAAEGAQDAAKRQADDAAKRKKEADFARKSAFARHNTLLARLDATPTTPQARQERIDTEGNPEVELARNVRAAAQESGIRVNSPAQYERLASLVAARDTDAISPEQYQELLEALSAGEQNNRGMDTGKFNNMLEDAVYKHGNVPLYEVGSGSGKQQLTRYQLLRRFDELLASKPKVREALSLMLGYDLRTKSITGMPMSKKEALEAAGISPVMFDNTVRGVGVYDDKIVRAIAGSWKSASLGSLGAESTEEGGDQLTAMGMQTVDTPTTNSRIGLEHASAADAKIGTTPMLGTEENAAALEKARQTDAAKLERAKEKILADEAAARREKEKAAQDAKEKAFLESPEVLREAKRIWDTHATNAYPKWDALPRAKQNLFISDLTDAVEDMYFDTVNDNAEYAASLSFDDVNAETVNDIVDFIAGDANAGTDRVTRGQETASEVALRKAREADRREVDSFRSAEDAERAAGASTGRTAEQRERQAEASEVKVIPGGQARFHGVKNTPKKNTTLFDEDGNPVSAPEKPHYNAAQKPLAHKLAKAEAELRDAERLNSLPKKQVEQMRKEVARLKAEIAAKGQDNPTSVNDAPAGGMPAEDVQAIVDRLKSKLGANIPRIVVVNHPHEVNPDQNPTVAGIVRNGTVYLFADNLDSVAHTEEVIYHEIKGHIGLRGFFGDRLDKALIALHASSPRIRAAAERERAKNPGRFKRMTPDQAIAKLTEEVLANMAGAKVEGNALTRFVAAAIKALRAMGFTKWASQLEDATMATAADMLTKAGEYLKTGKTGKGGAYKEIQLDAATSIGTAEVVRPQGVFAKVGEFVDEFLMDPKAKLTEMKLGWMTLEQMDARTGLLPLRKYIEAIHAMEAAEKDISAEAYSMDGEWAKLGDEKASKLGDVMVRSTLAQFDPTKDKPSTPEQRQLVTDLAALGDDSRKLYIKVRDFYADLQKQKHDLIKAAAEKPGKSTAHLDRMLAEMKGPYFPLVRLGKWYAVGMSAEVKALMDKQKLGELTRAEQKRLAELRKDPDHPEVKALRAKQKLGELTSAEAKQLAKLRKDPKHYVTRSFFSKREAVDFTKTSGMQHTYVNTQQERGSYDTSAIPNFAQLEDYLGSGMDPKSKAQIKNMLAEMYFDMLPNTSGLKQSMRREGIHGATFGRSEFAKTALSQARLVSRLAHIEDVNAAMVDIKKAAKNGGEEARMVENELVKRNEIVFDHSVMPAWADVAVKGSYLAHLGMSPAYWLTNATQVPMITLPWLAARHGFGNSNAALAKAFVDAKDIFKTSYSKDGWRFEFDWSTRFGKDSGEAKMLQRLLERNKLDVTIEHDLMAVAEQNHSKVNDVLKMMNTPVRSIEVINRATTGLAAYRLGLKKFNGDQEKAIEHAIRAVNDTQLDYSSLNAARHMQSVLGSKAIARVIMQFRKFQQGMIYLIASSAYDAVKGESAEVKAEAKRTLFGLFATTSLMAGSLGVPAAGTVMFIANILGQAFDDDDDPFDAEIELKNFVVGQLGKEVGGVALKGLPSLIGWDMSKRLGQADVFNPVPFFKQGSTGADSADNMLAAIAGAPFGTAKNMWDGIVKIGEGDYEKGLEKVIPLKLAQNLVRAYRYNEEGMTDTNGNPILPADTFSPWDLAVRAIGLQSTDEANAYEARAAMNDGERAAEKVRAKLLRKLREGDLNLSSEEVKGFNKRHPNNPINYMSLRASRKYHAQRAENLTDYGVVVDDSNEDYLDRAAFAIDEETADAM